MRDGSSPRRYDDCTKHRSTSDKNHKYYNIKLRRSMLTMIYIVVTKHYRKGWNNYPSFPKHVVSQVSLRVVPSSVAVRFSSNMISPSFTSFLMVIFVLVWYITYGILSSMYWCVCLSRIRGEVLYPKLSSSWRKRCRARYYHIGTHLSNG
jgi:hypothetical protein